MSKLLPYYYYPTKETLANLIEQYGSHHPDVATIYHNLAGLIHYLNWETTAYPVIAQENKDNVQEKN